MGVPEYRTRHFTPCFVVNYMSTLAPNLAGMSNEPKGHGRGGRIEFLKQKLEADRAALAAEMVKLARWKQSDDAKLFAHVGRAVCQVAAQSPQFHAAVKQEISPVLTAEGEKVCRWLKDKGWL